MPRQDLHTTSRTHSTPARAATSIDLRHLRYFVAVFDELHFGRAAERLHITQPPLSKAIGMLEAELSVPLLRRTSRSVHPTEAGAILAEHARHILASVDVAVAETRRAGGASWALRIGCVPDLPTDRLLKFLNAVHDGEPTFSTQVVHLLPLEQVRRLRGGDLDLGIFHYAGELTEIEMEPVLAGESLAAFVKSDSRLAAQEVLCPDDLHQEVMVVFPRTANPALYRGLLALIDRAGYRFGGLRETLGEDVRDLLVDVAEDKGVVLGPCSLLEVADVGGTVVRRGLDPPLTMPDTVVAWRANPPRLLQPTLAAVVEIARRLRTQSGQAPASGT
jgi:DNA-binding transcriptional LysR family regulator